MDFSATVGCENADGSDATTVDGSPEFQFELLPYKADDCIVYSFKYGEVPQFDVVVNNLIMPDIAGADKVHPVKARIVNHGSDIIESLSCVYTVDDGEEVSGTIDGLSVKNNEFAIIEHPLKWQPEAISEYQEIKLNVTMVNGNSLEILEENSASAQVFVNYGYTANKL
jgi:hypothetical protein